MRAGWMPRRRHVSGPNRRILGSIGFGPFPSYELIDGSWPRGLVRDSRRDTVIRILTQMITGSNVLITKEPLQSFPEPSTGT